MVVWLLPEEEKTDRTVIGIGGGMVSTRRRKTDRTVIGIGGGMVATRRREDR